MKIHLRNILLPMCTLFLAHSTVFAVDSNAVAKLLVQAFNDEEQGRTDLAVERSKKVLLLDPEQTEALACLVRTSTPQFTLGLSGELGTEIPRYLTRLEQSHADPSLLRALRERGNVTIGEA